MCYSTRGATRKGACGGLVGVAVVVVGRRRVGVGGASAGGIAHHGRVGRRAVVVGRRVGVVECPHPRPTVVLVHHNDRRV